MVFDRSTSPCALQVLSRQVLYPTGITGEIFQCIASLPHWAAAAPWWFYTLKVIETLTVTIRGEPFDTQSSTM
jgi:hypothetical protein